MENMDNSVVDFIKEHKDEDICVYYTPKPELGGVQITIRRNTALVKKAISCEDLSNMRFSLSREFLDSMYKEFDFEEDK